MSYVKFPRIPHFSFSPGIGDDDIVAKRYDQLYNNEVVVTEKMDGENTTLYNDYVHARSTTFAPHPSRSWIKRYWAENIAGRLAADMRICGENVYAKHSIHYTDLPTYFLVFGIWEGDFYVSWNDVVEYCQLFDLTHAPVLYRGFYDDEMVKAIAEQVISRGGEGVVVRVASGFDRSMFGSSVFKYVREGHVQTDDHWMSKPVVPNKLKEQENE